MKKIAAILSLIIFLFVVRSSANATGYCNFSPNGANGQPYGDVTISSNCVIYEDVNGTSLGNLTLQNTVITLNSTLVFPPGKQINIDANSIVYINTNGKIQQSLLCVKDADGDRYADVTTLNKDPESGITLTNPITQIGKVAAPIGSTDCEISNPGYVNSDLMNNLTMVDADPLTASATTIATSDRELLRLGFMINGVTDAFAGTNDIQIVNKNLLVCNGTSCPADNFLNLTPATGNIYVGGKVGIGTTNPTNALSIAGNIYSDAYISKIIQERAGYYSNYSELTTSPVGQGASWSVNSTYDPGAGNGVANSTFKVNAGTYNTGAGMIRFDGNSRYWGAWMSGASGGQGTAVTFTQLANLSTNGSWLSSRGTSSDFYLTNTGNVGIGTTNPGQKLAVAGTSLFSDTIYLPTAAGTNNISPGTGDGASYTTYNFKLRGWYGMALTDYSDTVRGVYDFRSGNLTTDGVAYFNGSGNNVFSGNVGIGTTSPGYKLTLGGTSTVFGIENATAFAAKNSVGSYENYLWPRWSDNVTYLNFGSAGFNIRNSGSTSVMVMQNNGNVGIGTGSPDTKLEVNGYADTVSGLTIDVAHGTYFLELDRNGTKVADIYKNTSGPLIFESFAAGSTTADFSFSGGNVGIGVTPSYKLDVSGTTRLNGNLILGSTQINSSSNRISMFYVGCSTSWATSCDPGANGWPDYADALFSDVRLKTITKPLTGVIDRIMQLKPTYYKWNENYDALGLPNHGQEIGFIAQDVQQLFPELVFNAGPNDPYYHLDYQKMTAVLAAGIKEQQVEIDSLKSQLTDLKNEVDQIKQLLNMPR